MTQVRASRFEKRLLALGIATTVHALALFALFGTASKSKFSMFSNDGQGAIVVALTTQSTMAEAPAQVSDGESLSAASGQEQSAPAAASLSNLATPVKDQCAPTSRSTDPVDTEHAAKFDDLGSAEAAVAAEATAPSAQSGEPIPPAPAPSANPWASVSVFLSNQHGSIFSIWSQVSLCWHRSAKTVPVTLIVKVNDDGSVLGRPSVVHPYDDDKEPGNAATNASETEAQGAVLACAPYTVPTGSSKTFKLVFDGGYK